MELAEIFELPTRFDRSSPGPRAERLIALIAAADDMPPRLRAATQVVRDAAALTSFALEGLPSGPVGEDEAHLVHRVAILALAQERDKNALMDPGDAASEELSADLESLEAAARGELKGMAGPLSTFVAATRAKLATCPGWDVVGAQFSASAATLLGGLAQEFRMRVTGRTDTLTPLLASTARGGWLVLVTHAIGAVCGDQSLQSKLSAAELSLRLAASVVTIANDTGAHLRGSGPESSKELIAQRFALPAHVIQLDDKDIGRTLSAVLELEVRDLVDSLGYLDPTQPLPAVIRRVVAATLELDGSAQAVVNATTKDPPDRKQLMTQMRDVAKADGQITADERALLRGMDSHLFDFQVLHDRIIEDRVIDAEEFEQMRTTRQTILDDLLRIALADNQITYDERQLLVRAMELLPTLR